MNEPFDLAAHPRDSAGKFSTKGHDEAADGTSALTSAGPRYRMVGTTDDVVECERCGKTELRATIVLEMRDADGNSEGVTYFGSSCAARALADLGVRTTGRKILDEARAAQRQRETEREDAVERLMFYGLPPVGTVDETTFDAALARFRASNAVAYRNNPRRDPVADFRALINRLQSRATI